MSDLTDVLGAPGPLYPTMLAVGAVYDESVVPARPVPAIWHLEIGDTTTMVPVFDDDLDAVAGQINGIAGIPLGYVAVGWTCPDDTPECLAFWDERRPTILVSEDGYDWQVSDLDLGEFSQGEMNEVVGLWFADPPGWVAVGGDEVRAFAARGSSSGDWTVVELMANASPDIEYALEDGSLGTVSGPCLATGRAVTVGSDGKLVAVGPCGVAESFMPYVTSWVSSDGVTWNQTTVPDGLDRPAWIKTITWSGEQYVAGGWLRGPDTDTPAVWTSDDGLTWSQVVISEAPGGVQDIAVGNGTQVAVGGWDTALIWIR